jgi:hypothetical protein
MGLIPKLKGTSLNEFARDPVACVDRFVAAHWNRANFPVPGGVERQLARAILSLKN